MECCTDPAVEKI